MAPGGQAQPHVQSGRGKTQGGGISGLPLNNRDKTERRLMKSGFSQLQQKLKRPLLCLPGPMDLGLACGVNDGSYVTPGETFQMDGLVKVSG